MRKSLVLCGFIALVFGCAEDTNTSVTTEEQSRPESSCTGGKCDAPGQVEVPVLEPIALDQMISCTVERDTSTSDEFFQADQGTCSFHGMPADGITLSVASIDIVASDGSYLKSHAWSGHELDSPQDFNFIARADDYPLQIRTTVYWNGMGFGLRGDIDAPENNFFGIASHGTETTVERPDESVAIPFAPELEIWPIVLWPTQDLEDAWAQKEVSFWYAVLQGDMEIPGKELIERTHNMSFSFEYAHSLFAQSHQESLTPLSQLKLFIPAVPGEPSSATLKTKITGALDESSTMLPQPGYYLIDKDGPITPASPEQVRERGARPTAAPVVMNPDMGDVSDPDSGSMDMGMLQDDMNTEPDMPVVDPCMDTCSDTQVCVNAQCVTRSQQAQSSCNVNPYKPCDLGEDSDCADGNVCVDGLCRLLTCQEQASCNVNPYRPCEQESHCADGNVCVEGLCRLLSCQEQVSCNVNPYRPCDLGEDSDCADGNVCVDGLCRLLTCQEQASCNVNPYRPCEQESHCADGNVCVEGLCRLLTCQEQASCNVTPYRPCEQDSHCADGNSCNDDGVCQKDGCN